MMKKELLTFLRDLLHGFLAVMVAVVLVLVLRVFFFASFEIPSHSMNPTIKAGDNILVTKLIPSPRLFKNFDFLKGGRMDMVLFNLFSIRRIRRNDVLVFNYPYTRDRHKIALSLQEYYVKRCVGIPGDSFYIDNGFYKVKNCTDTLGNYAYQKQVPLPKDSDFSLEVYASFPYDTAHYNWNTQHFGPLYIPKAMDTIAIDPVNYCLYKQLIEYETDQTLRIQKDVIYLGDQPLTHYVFRKNYYFMCGDQVMDSNDSRYWGLLSEDHIIGKAFLIWKSKDKLTGKYNWKRFFKRIE